MLAHADRDRLDRARRARAPLMAATPDGTQGEERAQCTPCRGTGKAISGLGGTPHEVTCPWCGGTGMFQPGRDAQASPAEGATTAA